MIKICRPFYEAKPNLVTQRFGVNPNPIQPNGHSGTDIIPAYPLKTAILVAPCKVKITNIINNLNIVVNSEEEIRRGFGIAMRPLEKDYPPDTYFLYWHCEPVFPVKINDVVEQGMPVAQMGNSGYVMWGGQYVPISMRNDFNNPGVHVHFEYYIEQGMGRKYMDVFPLIDWSIPIPKQGIINSVKLLLEIIQKLLNSK